MPSKVKTMLIGLCAVIGLLGCAVTGPYPNDWPEIGQAKLIGKCPDISGKYKNHGVSGPSTAKQITLTQILGVEDGDALEITQSPGSISISVWNSGKRSGDFSLVSGEKSYGWDTSRPGTFICPLDITSGRRSFILSEFSRPIQIGGTYGFAAAGWGGARLTKAADGSLVVIFEEGAGVLIVLLPIGKLERVWYRFEPQE